MMKKFVTAAVVAALVGVSSTCLAGFGLPKIGGGSKAPAASAQEEKSAPVDISNITNKQAEILRYTAGALYAQCRAYVVVAETWDGADKEVLEAMTGLNSTSKVKKADSVLKKASKNLAADAKKAIAEGKVQVNELAKAIKTGKVYQQAALVNYGFVAAHAPSALQEAGSAVKNAGKDINAVNKLNGAISTFKLGSQLAAASQKVNSEYDEVVNTIKTDGGVTDEAMANAPAPDVESIAAECLAVVDK